MWGEVAMRSLYFPRGVATIPVPPALFGATTCRVISIGPLLRELILRVAEVAALDQVDELERAGQTPSSPVEFVSREGVALRRLNRWRGTGLAT